MARTLILAQLDPDLACAIAVGLVEDGQVVANLDGITLHDGQMRPVGTQRGWLAGDDPLDVATREYLCARREAVLAGSCWSAAGAWSAANVARVRDEANRRALAMKEKVRRLLEERGVLDRARAAGLPVLA